jgi:signal transduction histidine kinase
MKSAPLPENENQRLLALQFYNILDTPEEEDFNEIVALASRICEAEISLISLIDESRQWFKAKVGLDSQETHRDLAFCAHAIHEPEIMEIEDTHEDERFFDNPLVVDDPRIRFYAGMPLETRDGYRLGTLCVIDSKPKHLTDEQRYALRILAKQAMKLMELRIKNQLLEQNIKIRERLLSILAHDVKGPVSSMGMMAEMLAEDPELPAETGSMLSEMHTVSMRTTQLIDNILGWARNLSTGNQIEGVALELSELVKEVAELNSTALSAKNLSLQTELTLENVVAEPQMLRFILRNLVGNAIKFSENGKITVKSKKVSRNRWQLEVSDQGMGMSQEQIDKLFNWQVRYTNFGTQKEKGTGLGLLLVREFVRSHYGQLHIHSKPGMGTTIKIEMQSL